MIAGRLTPPKVLEAVGLALYGENWVEALAFEYGINPRSVYNWLSGRRLEFPENHSIFDDLLEALKDRETYLTIPQAKKLLEDWMDDRQLPK